MDNGAPWPIQLSTSPTGATGWYLKDDRNANIKQNLDTLLSVPLGFMIRNEYFGTRLEETLEQPNNQALSHLVESYVKNAIATWETRINVVQVTTSQSHEGVHITVRYTIKGQTSEVFTYNNIL